MGENHSRFSPHFYIILSQYISPHSVLLSRPVAVVFHLFLSASRWRPCRGLPVFSRYSGGVLPCAFAVGDDVGDNLLFPLLQHRGRSWEKCDMRAAGTKKRGIVVDASFRVGRKNYCEMMLRNSFVAAWLGSTLKILLHHSIVLVNLKVAFCSSDIARYLLYSAM